MTRSNDERPGLTEFRAKHAALDLDVKLLRLGLKAGFNPSQPRVPAGRSGGGQWTGDGAGRSEADKARIATRHGHGSSPRRQNVSHTVSLPGGRRFVFRREGSIQTVLDGSGNPIGKAIWTPDGPVPVPVVQRVNAVAARQAIEAGRQLYNHLSAGNTQNQRACLAFTAKEFQPRGSIVPSLSFVGMLSRADTEAVCTKLDLVQRFSDEAMSEARLAGSYSNATVFGTAVHTRLHHKIVALKNPTLRSEYSLLKRLEETPLDLSAVRVDVLEDREVGPICVYDLKTGRRGLSSARTIEFATRLAHMGRPVIVIEVRPFE